MRLRVGVYFPLMGPYRPLLRLLPPMHDVVSVLEAPRECLSCSVNEQFKQRF